LSSTKTLGVSSAALLVCLAFGAQPLFHHKQEDKQTATVPPRPGEVKINTVDELRYVWVSPGIFMMGCSPDDRECRKWEKPSHEVTLTKGFWIGQTEVTVAAYQRFSSTTGRVMPFSPTFNSGWKNKNMPITNVSWKEAHDFCAWAGGRLPSEAEWEYAARGGDPHARYGNLDQIAWYAQNSGGRTHDVATRQANSFGLYDTLGNVWEWVNDWFDEDYYQNSPSQDPKGPDSGQYKVLRGGSWFYFPRFVRGSVRLAGDPAGRVGNFGLRCIGEGNLP